MTDFKRPSSAEVTPATPEAARAIRDEVRDGLRRTHDEITDVRDLAGLIQKGLDNLADKQDSSDKQRELLRGAVGSAVDRISETPDIVRQIVVMELDRFRDQMARDRREDAAAVRVLITDSERRSTTKIEANAKRLDGHDTRLDELDLRLAVSFADVDREREEVTGVTQTLVKRVDRHEGFITRHETTIATVAGSTGLTLAITHVWPLLKSSLKAYAASKGWTK